MTEPLSTPRSCTTPPQANASDKASRRNFLQGAAGVAALMGINPRALFASGTGATRAPFHISCIADEVSQDFDHACYVIKNDFKLDFIEIREIGNKSPIALDAKTIADAQKSLAKYKLKVTDVGSPLFKVDFKGAPASKFSPKRDSFGASYGFDDQNEVLEKSIALAKAFGTDRIRGFDFWRLDDQAPYRAAMNAKLHEASVRLAKDNMILVLENEASCNTATTAESVTTLAGVSDANFMLNWDPGNAVAAGEMDVMPAYANLPKARIGHVHCKNAVPNPSAPHKSSWSPVDIGVLDWAVIFRALKRDGYSHSISLETHWRGAGEGGREAGSVDARKLCGHAQGTAARRVRVRPARNERKTCEQGEQHGSS